MTLGIALQDVSLRYGDTAALDGLTLALEGGKIYGLLGRNGSGKTSLLTVLAAFRRATAGTVLVGGRPVFENRDVTSQVCLIRDSGSDTGDGGDRVSEALDTARRLRPRWDDDYARRLIERFELPVGKKVRELPRGQRAALGITIGLATRAPLTMFDESHLGMDAPSRQAFADELLADFMAHPRTVIVSTHLIEELSSLFEEVVILDEGRVVLHDDTEALRARGAAVTGPAEAVDRVVAGLTVLDQRQLGHTKSAVVYGGLDATLRRRAADERLDIGPLALQDLFTHLTQRSGDHR